MTPPAVWGGDEPEEDGVRMPRALSMSREVGQSFYLMGLMAVMLTVYVGLGLLAVRLIG